MGLWWDKEPEFDEYYDDVAKCREHALIVLRKKHAHVLLQHISNHNKQGCKILTRGFETRNCSASMGSALGYYHHGKKQIVVCCNKAKGYKDLESVITHELVHAYDFCRFNSLWYCKTRACSEVRAYNLGGSCHEPAILNMFNNNRNECLRQHAIASTRPSCPTTAIQDVDRVFDLCHNDHTPVEDKTRNPGHMEFNPNILPDHEKRFTT